MDEKEDNITSTLVFFVNGKKVEDDNVDPQWTLLHYLRNKLKLCGTKLGCGEGGCGACTVMVSKYNRQQNKVIHLPVNACLAPVCAMHGLAVTTVEGIGSTKMKLHPVQERIAKAHGSQCGFCTPGIVMSMYTLLRSSPGSTMKQLETALQGNLCRCTGYRPILEGYKTFTKEWELAQRIQQTNSINDTNCESRGVNGNVCGMGDKCCKLQNIDYNVNNENHKLESGDGNSINDEEVLFCTKEFIPYHPSQEPIFPPELKISDKFDNQYLVIQGEDITWYKPTKLCDLLQLKSQYPEGKIVVGNTEIGVEMKFKHMSYSILIHPIQIPELIKTEITETGISIGASTTLIDLEEFLIKLIGKFPEHKTRIFKALLDMLNWFASKQIRSVCGIGGNIMTGSPISDLLPILIAAKAKVTVESLNSGTRELKLNDEFFIGYRKSVVKPEEVLQNIHIPWSIDDQYFYAYKQARRREDDIAIVNAAVNVIFKPKTNIISKINLAFGGMSFKTVTTPKTEMNLRGLPWNRDTLEVAYSSLMEDLPLDPGAPGGMVLYRRSLILSLFFKAYLAISQKLQERVPNIYINPKEKSGSEIFHSKDLKSAQCFTVVPEDQSKIDPVQRPIVHMSAYKQATGEAVYCDDIPALENELYLGLVLSKRPHARIVSIDSSKALSMKGVHAVFTADDLQPEQNRTGSILKDELIFYSDMVTSQGQIIAAVIAEGRKLAKKASSVVQVEYEDLQPVILTIEEAIESKSFFKEFQRHMVSGDIDRVLQEAPHVVAGECRIGGQEHFYMETQSVIVEPKEDEIYIYSSTQNPTEISTLVSEALGIPQHKVITKVKRLGGGFGGKESRASLIALPAAVAASRLHRPVRCVLERDEDIVMTGGRHPVLAKYRVAFDDDGRILGCDLGIYANCGYSADLSFGVVGRAMTHFENGYHIPTVRVAGYACKTNLPSNTAFRGFGAPQGMFVGETIIRDIAHYLSKDVVEISRLNLNKEGDVTFYKQPLTGCTLQQCWDEVMESSKYHERRKAVNKFNRHNRYKKRGLSVVPTKFGIGYSKAFLNQAGALVLVYRDGSVLLTHGGVEMGQGLHTKMIQIASRVLDIPTEKIHISETATDKVPNTSATAASTGSDLNGMAVLEACQKIKNRLQPFEKAVPNGRWEDWVEAAYMDRVSLSATGYYKTPDIGFDFEKGEGRMFNYFTYGAAVTEVEIDTLTGDHQILRTDIVMDLACQKIKNRLQPFEKAVPNGRWEDWVEAAYMDRVSLSATGYYKTPDIGFDFEKGEGRMFNYFTYGAAVTEVEIDTLTGDHQILRTDIVMDLGQSLNPAIDIGQIEGAFMQGYGLFVMEEMMYAPDGTIYTRGPGTYKIPGFGDIPAEFNVSLLKGASNQRAVYSSKAVGEPPLFLSSSVLFSIIDAIKVAREEEGLKDNFRLNPPATPEKIRLLCSDSITSKFEQPSLGTYKPWNINV